MKLFESINWYKRIPEEVFEGNFEYYPEDDLFSCTDKLMKETQFCSKCKYYIRGMKPNCKLLTNAKKMENVMPSLKEDFPELFT